MAECRFLLADQMTGAFRYALFDFSPPSGLQLKLHFAPLFLFSFSLCSCGRVKVASGQAAVVDWGLYIFSLVSAAAKPPAQS